MQNISKHADIKTAPNNQLITIDNSYAKAQISLFGAHVLSFTPKHDGRERLWLSPQAVLDGSAAIRGGVPICWPWFSNQFPEGYSDLPAHGFARTQHWNIESIVDNDKGETVVLMSLDCAAMPGFPFNARLEFSVTVAEQLKMALCMNNLDEAPWSMTCALHSYFKVSQLKDVTLQGVTGLYRDKTRNFERFTTPEHYCFEGEVDRIHETNSSDVIINEGDAKTLIQHQGHDSLVIWNPGQQLVHTISNIPNDAVHQFACVEAANTSPREILPGKQHTLTQIIA